MDDEIVRKTANIEFVPRNGKMILTQEVEIKRVDTGEVRYEWRDVPVNHNKERAA